MVQLFKSSLMCDSLACKQSRHLYQRQPQSHFQRVLAFVPLLILGFVGLSIGATAQAASPETAPTALTETITQIDAAANQHDVQAVMRFYDRQFTHSDGLTYTTLQQALSGLWQRYPTLSYQTELTAWEAAGNGFIAETTTTITGTESLNGRELTLNATIASRQRFENQTIVEQDILSEQNRTTTGANPPTLVVNLPETVSIGRDFAFDAIVQEPLGDRLILGAAIEEPVSANAYVTTPEIDLELLSSGGLFKTGRAPALPDDRWLSAVIVREDGITTETRRLQVTNRLSQ